MARSRQLRRELPWRRRVDDVPLAYRGTDPSSFTDIKDDLTAWRGGESRGLVPADHGIATYVAKLAAQLK
jgi:hypothetical protein